MDSSFWLGIIAGALVGIPFSIAANLWTDPIRELIERRRHIRYSNRKSRELSRYHFVKDLHQGAPRARTLLEFEIFEATRAVMFFCVALLFTVCSFIWLQSPRAAEYYGAARYVNFFFLSVSMLSYAVVVSTSQRLRQLRTRLIRFEEYEQAIYEKWSDAGTRDQVD
ncbi:hypothetical protein BjapCC829_22050 [Bradyrhizobium barranii]|uniref:DUF2721 domain-containing protein n=1 Tax=Bradyrhizobium barranii TaxID=2992140 RepID=A0ABY3R072_9BRAD|nr:hypothetical protein [Bradyrhizobium japonicum]UFW91074.1 hypothetical protein BjapCC829_22050 [Bradyrhizobium japonicum]